MSLEWGKDFVVSRPVMSKLDVVLANPVPYPQGSHFHSWGGGGDKACVQLCLRLAAGQGITGGWRRGGKELVQPGLLLVCSEANCWENPMTLKPSLSLRTEKNRSQNKAPSGNMPDSRDKQPVGLGYSLVGSCRAGQGWWR